MNSGVSGPDEATDARKAMASNGEHERNRQKEIMLAVIQQ
jgi:hypothetical protein